MITHTAILAALAELRATAEAAKWGHDHADRVVWDDLQAFRDFWSPAGALRWVSWAEQVAAEHPETAHRCDGGDFDWDVCGPMRRLASALGLEETP